MVTSHDRSRARHWPRRATTRAAPAMKDPGRLRRFLGRRHEPLKAGGGSGAAEESALDLADIQGFVLRAYRMPMVRHFLLAVGSPAQARRQLGRLVKRRRIRHPASHDCPGLARRVRARTARRSRRCPASHARLLPQRRHHVARTGSAGGRGTRPDALVQVVRRIHRRSRATSGAGRRYRSQFARELGRGLWRRRRSRPGDAARHQPGGDDELQRQAAGLVCRGRCLSRNLAAGRDGVDGDARWPTRADCQGALRIHRRHQHAHHSRRS